MSGRLPRSERVCELEGRELGTRVVRLWYRYVTDSHRVCFGTFPSNSTSRLRMRLPPPRAASGPSAAASSPSLLQGVASAMAALMLATSAPLPMLAAPPPSSQELQRLSFGLALERCSRMTGKSLCSALSYCSHEISDI